LDVSDNFEHVQVGTEIPGIVIGPLDRLAFARISVALDDPNLVHLDENVARKAGFPDVIGSGGIVIGILYEVVRRWVGLEQIVSGQTRQLVPFPAYVSLSAYGKVIAIEQIDDHREAVCQVSVTDQQDTEVGNGTFRVRLK
jgi:acyl dehydratase